MSKLPGLSLLPALAIAVNAASLDRVAQPPVRVPQATVTGTVFDGLDRSTLPGATVQLVGTADSVLGRTFSTSTDSSGNFSFRELPPGSYLAGFFHPALDTLGIESGNQAVDLHNGSQRLLLTSPTSKVLIEQICAGGVTEDTTGLLIGHVRDAATGAPIEGASITAEWGETVIARGGVNVHNRNGTAESHAAGWFALCGVPSDVELTVRAGVGFDSTGYVEVTVPRHGVRHLTMRIGGARRVLLNRADQLPQPVDTTASDSAPAVPRMLTTWRGTAAFTGRVFDEHGQPLGDVRAVLLGTGLGAVSNSNGYFTLDSLPGGTQSVELRAVGYLPERTIVQLTPDAVTRREVRLATPVTTLPTVNVRGTLVFSRNLARFERHRETTAGGFFLGPHDIEKRPVTRFSSLLEGIPGVHTLFNAGTMHIGMDSPATQGGAPIYCEPSIFVDGGRRHYDASDLEGLFYSDDIAGLEVYRRPNETPIEYRDSDSRCGAIVVWTRPSHAKRGEPPPR
jgi:hypothetical protein